MDSMKTNRAKSMGRGIGFICMVLVTVCFTYVIAKGAPPVLTQMALSSNPFLSFPLVPILFVTALMLGLILIITHPIWNKINALFDKRLSQ